MPRTSNPRRFYALNQYDRSDLLNLLDTLNPADHRLPVKQRLQRGFHTAENLGLATVLNQEIINKFKAQKTKRHLKRRLAKTPL